MEVLRIPKLTFVLFIILLPVFVSCGGGKSMTEKRQEQLSEQEEAKEEHSESKMEEAREHHMDIQTRKTRKRMKRTRRKSKRYNQNKKPFFLWRWLGWY